MEEIIIGRG